MTTETLHDKHAVVTGAGRGLGAAIASALSEQGAKVTLMGRTAATLERQADAIRRATGRPAQTTVCDVADASSITRAFADATSRTHASTSSTSTPACV